MLSAIRQQIVENQVLTSIKNPLIKQVRKLHRSRERQKQNLLLLEGTNLVEAACQVDYKLDIFFCTCSWSSRHEKLFWELEHKGIEKKLVSPEVLKAIATTVNPDGIVAIAKRRIISSPIFEQTQLAIALETLQDPGNLGTIIRTAVAADLDGLWLSPNSVEPDHPKVLRASAGEWFRMAIATGQDLSEVVKQHQLHGIQAIATSSHSSKNYWDVDFSRPSLILLGNEGAGLSAELLNLADERVKIPTSNGVESLNVAIATALLVYEARRQIKLLYE